MDYDFLTAGKIRTVGKLKGKNLGHVLCACIYGRIIYPP